MQVVAQKAVALVNASSGRQSKENIPSQLQAAFAESAIDMEVKDVSPEVDIKAMAREAVASGAGIVVAGGGDGTLRAVASALVGTDVTFGVLPVGTLNHFARDLNIPLNVEGAAAVIAAGHSRYVDVATVNDEVFLNNSILGLYPVYRFLRAKEEQHGWHKRFSFIRAIFGVLRRWPSMRLRLNVDGKEVVRTTPYILIGNNEHAMEGYTLGLRRCIHEGKLWIYVMRKINRWGALKLFFQALIGRFRGPEWFECLSAEELWVETRKRKRIGVAYDGEVCVMQTPLHYKMHPKALKVFAPPVDTTAVEV